MANLRTISHVKRDGHWHSIGYKTKVRFSEGYKDRFEVYHYNTKIVAWDGETLFVNTAGWFSKTTAERIRHALAAYPINLQLLTRDLPNRWRIADYRGNAWTIRGNYISLVRDNTCEWRRA